MNGLTDPMSKLIDLSHPQITHKDLVLTTPGKLFSAPGWIYEIKYDGFRCLVCKHGDVVRLESRRGRDMERSIPGARLRDSPHPKDFVADTELVILDDQGRPQWDRRTRGTCCVTLFVFRQAATRDPAALFACDLLSLNGA